MMARGGADFAGAGPAGRRDDGFEGPLAIEGDRLLGRQRPVAPSRQPGAIDPLHGVGDRRLIGELAAEAGEDTQGFDPLHVLGRGALGEADEVPVRAHDRRHDESLAGDGRDQPEDLLGSLGRGDAEIEE